MLNEQHVTRAQFIIISIAILGVPIAYLPILANSSELPKQLLLITITTLLLFLAWMKLFLTKKISLSWSFPQLSLIGLTMVTFASLILHQGQPQLSLTHPFGALTILAMTLFITTVSSLAKQEEYQAKLRIVFLAASIITGIASLLWMAGQIIPSIQLFPFHLAGNAKSALIIQWLPILLIIPSLIQMKKSSGLWPMKLTNATITAICMAVLTTILMLVRFQSISMPTALGWQVAMEALKIKPLDGVGPLNYEHLFVQSRPATLNVSPLWNVRFLSAPNLLFHVLSIFGSIGVVLVLVLALLPLVQTLKKPRLHLVPVLGILAALLFGPPDLLVLFTIVLTSVFVSKSFLLKEFSLSVKPVIIGLVILLPLAYLLANLFFFWPVVRTEMLLARATKLVANNQPDTVPALISQAQKITPYRDDIAAFASQLMLQNLINSLQNTTNQTPEFQQQAMQEINATINMAQQAIVLNPVSSSNWKNLADVYARLRPYVDNADQWSIRTLEQTVMRDPSNAFIKAEIADVFFAQGNNLRALQMLENAVSLKPDYPPFMYALARLYVQVEDYQSAKQALLQTQALLPETSEDRATVQNDLVQLEAVINNPQPVASPAAQMVEPTPSPTQPSMTPRPSVAIPPTVSPSPTTIPLQ